MSFSGLFIRRPVATTLLMLAILIFGIVGYRLLPVADLPNVDFPTLQVSANLPGASPETMACGGGHPAGETVLHHRRPDLDDLHQLQGAPASPCSLTSSRDLDAAAQDVQSAISTAQRRLPRDMPSPPSYRKVNPADSPILFLALTSAYPAALDAQRVWRDNDGPAHLDGQRGGAGPGVRLPEIRRADASSTPAPWPPAGSGSTRWPTQFSRRNVNLPTGTLLRQISRSYTVESNGQLTDAAGYEPMIVTYRNGRPVRLGELGRVIDSVENNKSAAWFIDDRAIVLAVQRQPGTNTVQVVRRRSVGLIPTSEQQLPPSVSLKRAVRPLGVDPRVGERCQVHPLSDRLSWWCW